MKILNVLFGVPCLIVMAIVGASLVGYAGPCYINTGTVKTAEEKGCFESWFFPAGLSCPGMISLEKNEAPIRACSVRRISHVFNIGTAGNKDSGRMEQGNVSRKCYSYQHCNLLLPQWLYGASFLHPGAWIYKCRETEAVSGNATADSWEATGNICPEDIPEDDGG